MHQELQLTFLGNANQILHLGPLELKGGETKYLPIKNNIASFKQLSEIKSLSVRKVTVADKDDKVEALGKDVVVKSVTKKISVTYIGNQWEKPVRGLGSFYRNQPRIDLKEEQIVGLRTDNEFKVVVEE